MKELTLPPREISSFFTSPYLSQHSNSLEDFRRQYCIQREPTVVDRILDSDHNRIKVVVSAFLFILVILIGGYITKWCEWEKYDEIVEEDTAFREEIRAALNGTGLFDELDTRYTNWIVENPWSSRNCLFYWLSVMTTIGYGNIFPVTTAGRLWTVIFGILSILASGLFVRILGNSHKDILSRSKTYKAYPKTCLSIIFITSSVVFAAIFYWYEHDAGIGPRGEEGWTYIQSIYFVIITFTTVGFGDFVHNAGITVILIIYGIMMLTMLVAEAHTSVKRLETGMRDLIHLVEEGCKEVQKSMLKEETINNNVSPKTSLGIELQQSNTGISFNI